MTYVHLDVNRVLLQTGLNRFWKKKNDQLLSHQTAKRCYFNLMLKMMGSLNCNQNIAHAV